MIKDKKMKVQAAIQGEQVRVTGKKRDDLQEVMAMLKAEESITLPLQFNNFRDWCQTIGTGSYDLCGNQLL